MTDSAAPEWADPGMAARAVDLDRQAGVLALEVARASSGGVGYGRRASRHAVLRVLLDAVHAHVVACYVASSDAGVRRVALAARDMDVAPSQLVALRRAVLDWTLAGSEPPREAAAHDSGIRVHLTGAILVLALGPQGPAGAGAVMAVAWPAEDDVVPQQVALIGRVAPILQLALLPLVERTSARATRHRRLDVPHADVIAQLSHDLRTPLNTLGGFLELVLEERAGPLNDRQREFLGYARESANRLASLIEQIPIENSSRHAVRGEIATKSARPAPSSYGS